MSIKEEIGSILQKYHYEDIFKVPEIKGAKHYNRINEATLADDDLIWSTY